MADATAHLARQSIFTKTDCTPAFFSTQMADSLSVQLLAFTFGGRTFKRLKQRLSRSLTAFSSCVNKHLPSCVASDKCFVYFDDQGSGARDGNTLIDYFEEIFCCIQSLDFKLSIEKYQLSIPKIQFHGHETSAAGISPNKQKVEKVLEMFECQKPKNKFVDCLDSCNIFKNFIPNLALKNCTLSSNYYEKNLILALRTNIKNLRLLSRMT